MLDEFCCFRFFISQTQTDFWIRIFLYLFWWYIPFVACYGKYLELNKNLRIKATCRCHQDCQYQRFHGFFDLISSRFKDIQFSYNKKKKIQDLLFWRCMPPLFVGRGARCRSGWCLYRSLFGFLGHSLLMFMFGMWPHFFKSDFSNALYWILISSFLNQSFNNWFLSWCNNWQDAYF